MLDMISHQQRNIIFLNFAWDIEDSIEYFPLQSNILTLIHNCYKSLHVTARVAYHKFLRYFQLSPNLKRGGSVSVSNTILPKQYYVETILNDTPCLNVFPLFPHSRFWIQNSKSLTRHVTARVSYHLFLCYFQLSPNLKRGGSVSVSNIVLPKWYYLETILNEIPCVNLFPLFPHSQFLIQNSKSLMCPK